MKSYRTLALRELSAQKMTSILILIAVVLSTAMTTVAGQSAGVLSAMREQQAVAIGGSAYASLLQLTGEQAAMLESDPRLSYVGRSVHLGTVELNSLLSLGIAEYWDGGTETQPASSHVLEGRLPVAPMELALPEDALQFLGFTGNVGDSIILPVSKALRHGAAMDSYEYTAEFTLTGITQSNYLGYASGFILGLAGKGTAAAVLPPEYLYYNVDIRTTGKGSFQAVVDDWNARLDLHELDTNYNIPYLNALGIRYNAEADGSLLDDDGFSFILLAGILVVGLILLAAGLVIYNILKIAVTQRIRQYGTLRAIGAERRQLYAVVAIEILLLCAAGIPVGMGLGFLSAKGILTAVLNQLPPQMFLAQDARQLQELIAANSSGKWGHLLLSAAVTLLFAFLAAAPAAWFAARVSPVAAMSGASRKHMRRRRETKTIRNFERYYARLNLSRSRGRTAVTVLSLVMSITVFIALQSFLGFLSVSGGVSEHLGDYSIVNEYTGIAPEDAARLEAGENVAAMAAEQFSIYDLDEQYHPIGIETDFSLNIGEKFQVFGYNDLWAEYAFAERLTPERLEALKAGEGCIVRNPIPMQIGDVEFGTTHIEEGRVLTIAGKKLTVLLALNGYDGYFSVGNSGFINGVQILVSSRLYPQLTGKDAYAELRPVLSSQADRAAFDARLSQFCRQIPGTAMVSYEQTDRQLQESEAQINLLAWGLILFIGLIGILNIINTIYTNIHTRITETGVQRAIGMSMAGLYKTFLWEGVYYGIFASAAGCAAGYACVILMESAKYNTLSLAPPPVVPMAEAAGLSVSACLLAAAIPLRKIARLNIVDSIEAVE